MDRALIISSDAISQGGFAVTGDAWTALGIAPPTSVKDVFARALAAA